jgi:hypothetical protein
VQLTARKKTAIRVLAATVVAALAVTGAILYRESRPTSYAGDPAVRVARDLGCTDFAPVARPSSIAGYHDQGICRMGDYTVKVTTFNDQAEQRAFGILMNSLVPAYTHRGGAYAEGDGWNVADNKHLSKAAAVTASTRLRGAVREFSATTKS